MAGGNGGARFDTPGGAGGTIDPATGAPRKGGDGTPGVRTGGGGGSAGGGAGGSGATTTDASGTTTSGGGGRGGDDGLATRRQQSNSESATGGAGQKGGDASGTASFAQDQAAGGGGGEGGYGLILTGNGGLDQITNTGNLTGGRGGAGGFGLQPGSGGDGGVALAVLGTGVRYFSRALLTGGDGGAVGGSNYLVEGSKAGRGGAGLTGRDLTVINAGTIVGGLSGDTVPVRSDAITFTGGTNLLQLTATDFAIGTLTGGIGVSGTLTIDPNSNQTVGFDNLIHDAGAGPGSLRVVGYGVRLTADNTYTGTTTVERGSNLILDGSITSDVTVTGSNFVGAGRVNGSVTVTDGALSGNRAGDLVRFSTGRLTITGALTLDAASDFIEEIAGRGSFDTVQVSGAVTLGNARLNLNFAPGATSTRGDTVYIIDNLGKGPVTGRFTNPMTGSVIGEGDTLADNGRTYQFSYRGGDGNDVTIQDVTAGPALPVYTIAVDPASAPEGTPPGAGTTFTYTVSRAGDVLPAAAVNLSFDGSATQPFQVDSDYSVASGTGTYVPTSPGTGQLGFAAGQRTATFLVTARADIDPETDETVLVTLTGVAGGDGTIGAARTATATIVDDHGSTGSSFSIADAPATVEGGQLVFVVSRSGDAATRQSVTVETEDVTATAGQDYDRQRLVLDFAPGVRQADFIVQTLDDRQFEGGPNGTPETLLARLSAATGGAVLGDATARGSIRDNEAPRGGGGGGGGGGGDEEAGGLYILGTPGPDPITGAARNDTLLGAGGNDTITGREGDDLIQGNQGNDLLLGNQGNDTIFGGQDQDTVFGGQGDDCVQGNLGGDLLFGNTGSDTLCGGQDADTLYGGQGDDLLYGDLGDDALSGDLGNDVLDGGAGADRYVFGQNSGSDAVFGFSQAEGDRLDLQGQTYTFGTAADGSGSALLVLSGGGSIELAGITPEQVKQDCLV